MRMGTAIGAVVFDFDGVILDTEEPDYLAWREIWGSYGQDLVLEEWALCIGTAPGPSTFHPFDELVRRSGLDLSELRARKRQIAAHLVAGRPVLPGVMDWLDGAGTYGLGVAIASSSPRSWIDEHLSRLGLLPRFPVIACFDDCGVTKPDPASYLLACGRLGVRPSEALAVEDSVHGVAAAKSAGLACVAVPTPMTAHFDFGQADLTLPSLSSATLGDVTRELEALG
jgi:HAD superfamily hydrolase (TIGR01509 family)